MTITEQKTTVNELSNGSVNTMEIGVYTIYDCVLQKFDIPIAIPVSKLYDYMSMIVNDVSSKYYGHETDYILNKIGNFNSNTGEFEKHFIERVSILDSYIDNNQRKLQTIIKVLNYLPSGYFKMPMEQKQSIQEKIDCAITEYVANYVIPDLDVSKFDTRKIQDIYKHYDELSDILNKDNSIDFDCTFAPFKGDS